MKSKSYINKLLQLSFYISLLTTPLIANPESEDEGLMDVTDKPDWIYIISDSTSQEKEWSIDATFTASKYIPLWGEVDYDIDVSITIPPSKDLAPERHGDYWNGRFANGPVWSEYLPYMLSPLDPKKKTNNSKGGSLPSKRNFLEQKLPLKLTGKTKRIDYIGDITIKNVMIPDLPGMEDQRDELLKTAPSMKNSLLILKGGANQAFQVAIDALMKDFVDVGNRLSKEQLANMKKHMDLAIEEVPGKFMEHAKLFKDQKKLRRVWIIDYPPVELMREFREKVFPTNPEVQQAIINLRQSINKAYYKKVKKELEDYGFEQVVIVPASLFYHNVYRDPKLYGFNKFDEAFNADGVHVNTRGQAFIAAIIAKTAIEGGYLDEYYKTVEAKELERERLSYMVQLIKEGKQAEILNEEKNEIHLSQLKELKENSEIAQKSNQFTTYSRSNEERSGKFMLIGTNYTMEDSMMGISWAEKSHEDSISQIGSIYYGFNLNESTSFLTGLDYIKALKDDKELANQYSGYFTLQSDKKWEGFSLAPSLSLKFDHNTYAERSINGFHISEAISQNLRGQIGLGVTKEYNFNERPLTLSLKGQYEHIIASSVSDMSLKSEKLSLTKNGYDLAEDSLKIKLGLDYELEEDMHIELLMNADFFGVSEDEFSTMMGFNWKF